MNLEGRGSSVVASHRPKESRPKSSNIPVKSRATGPEEDSYDDEEIESVGSPGLSSTRVTPRLSWMEHEHDMIDMSTQTVVHSGIFSLHAVGCKLNSPRNFRGGGTRKRSASLNASSCFNFCAIVPE